MVNTRLSMVLLAALCFSSCHKADPASKPVEFTTTVYANLGSYDASGKPDYLVAKDVISPGLLAFIPTMLSDGRNLTKSHPELFDASGIADITIKKPSDVYITFVSQGSGLSNAFAYYTYPTGQSPQSAKDIRLITYIFPNVGFKTTLTKGDKVKIGRFDVGTSIGFVLLKNSWDTTAKILDDKVVHFCSNDALNPEVDPKLKKHAVLIDYAPESKVLIGFEDTDRTYPSCDNDFNDLVVYCTVTN